MRSSTYSKLCRRAWIGTRPGRSSEITTARHHDLPAKLRDAGLAALADLGFVGLDDDPVEHGFADLKGRRVLTKPVWTPPAPLNCSAPCSSSPRTSIQACGCRT
ncbi:hypothetical protein [Nonomuraea sp. NPDC049158]|uniref:hypothetical protein n=1 Tax=Nonomuraea sp. NPDC049158 TaxID=3155649 RepID=UPI00340B276D